MRDRPSEPAGLGFDQSTLGALVDDSADAVVIVDDTGTIRYANRAVHQVLGYQPDDLMGARLDMLVPESQRASHAGHVRRFRAAPSARPLGMGRELAARRSDGSELPVEIALVPLRTREGHVAAMIRDSSVRHRLTARLAASHQLVTAMLGGMEREATLRLGSTLAGQLVHADTCCIALVDHATRRLEILAAHGSHGDRLIGQSAPVEQSLVWAGERAGTLIAEDLRTVDMTFPQMASLPLGPLLVVRIGNQQQMLGSITFVRATGAQPFDDTDTEIAVQFADALNVALVMTDVRAEVEELDRMTEHDRIARDLHDTVIQRIFGVAMRLESAMPLAAGPAADRIDEAVATLDEVIRDIRTTIFGLQHPQKDTHGVRGLFMREVDDAAVMLGFTPRLGFVGPVEMLVSLPLARTVVNVLREALSNVVQHADASQVEVVVRVEEDLCLTVLDDGVGLRDEPTAGQGLVNLQKRAMDLGGDFSITGRETGGTILQWRVPLHELGD